MTVLEAKQVLLLYRPGTADAYEPQIAEALALARQDPGLGDWFRQHCEFQGAARHKLRSLEVPSHLKAALLAPPTVVRFPAWRAQRLLWAAAACALLLVGGALWLLRTPEPNGFANLEARMVSGALREYSMDVVTHSMPVVRKTLAEKGAPADYELTPGLEKLQLTGGGVLRWRGNPVGMVCFDRGDNQMLFLFVLHRSAVKDPPPETPQVNRVRELASVSWSRGDKTYILAGPEEADFARKYL